MLESLNNSLQTAYADCTGFMMLKIDLPDTYEDSIVETQVVNQEKNTQESISKAAVIRAQIEVDRSNATMQVAIINGQAESAALVVKNEAEAKVKENTITY
jgi:hypothetical protein